MAKTKVAKLTYNKSKERFEIKFGRTIICYNATNKNALIAQFEKSQKAKKLGIKKFEDLTEEEVEEPKSKTPKIKLNLSGFDVDDYKKSEDKVAHLIKDGIHYKMVYNGKVLCKNISKSFIVDYFLNKSIKAQKAGVKDFVDDTGEHDNASVAVASHNVIAEISKEFTVDQRFNFLNQGCKMVAQGHRPSLICTGTSGIGKTFEVQKMLEELNLFRDTHYIYMKGVCTPRAFYNSLYDNPDKLFIFDDCDSVLEDDDSIQILKGATDSYDQRWVSYTTIRDKEREPTFIFRGSIIFISNKRMAEIDKALLTRSLPIDITLSKEEILERMASVLTNIGGVNFDKQLRLECFDFIKKNVDICRSLSLRSLIDVMTIRKQVGIDGQWQDLAKYTLMVSP